MTEHNEEQFANEEIETENAEALESEIEIENAEGSENEIEIDDAEGSENEIEIDDGIATLKKALLESNTKVEENWNLFLSAKAETDNIQKRAERDVANAYKYALEKFIPELLTVKDSLELGTKAAKENTEVELEKFLEGSEMAISMFVDVLSKVGVATINPEGGLFNPELHQAITMIPNPDLPANTIMEVIQKGYSLNERLLRPAMVILSKAD